MNIKQQLELPQSKENINLIINYVGNDKIKFKELIGLLLKGDYQLRQRAAWPLSYVSINQPQLIQPYIGSLLKTLKQTNNHPAVARNILKIFEIIDIPVKIELELLEICFLFIKSIQQPIAIRAFAITVATRICKKYPELIKELLLYLSNIQNYPMEAAIKVRVKKSFKDLKYNP